MVVVSEVESTRRTAGKLGVLKELLTRQSAR